MTSSIPKPTVPTRPRRSSIAQAAENTQRESDQLHDEGTTQAGDETELDASEAAAPPPPPPPPAATPTNSKRLENSTDILFALPVDEKERMVNAIAWTTAYTGIRHQSRFIRWAIARACEDLEKQHNNGAPFQPPAVPDF